MRVLFIGGSGEISFDCIHESVRHGHDVSVFNRGNNNAGLPPSVRFIQGDIHDAAAYSRLADEHFDVICQFRLFTIGEMAHDLRVFTGHTGQYVFISTASAYAKPVPKLPITEDVPLANPYWDYSKTKAAMEQKLRAQSALPFTIVRPSHTYRTRMPMPLPDTVSRLLRRKPVVVPGDGTSRWTITHAEDFAPVFARLLGNPKALGEAVHLTGDAHWTWDEIIRAAAAALHLGEPDLVHVPAEKLVHENREWVGPLLGDKAVSAYFDNAKVRSLVGTLEVPHPPIDCWRGMQLVAERYPPTAEGFDPTLDMLYDRIIEEAR